MFLISRDDLTKQAKNTMGSQHVIALKNIESVSVYHFGYFFTCVPSLVKLRQEELVTSGIRSLRWNYELRKYEIMIMFNNAVSYSTMFMATSQHDRSWICVKYQCRSLQLFFSDLSVLLALLSSTSETSSSGAPVTFKQLVKIKLVSTSLQLTTLDKN